MVFLKLLFAFSFYLLLPGICILLLTNYTGIVGIRKYHRLFITVPLSFGLSIGLTSVLGWLAYGLDLGFIGVRGLVLLFAGGLITGVIIQQGYKFIRIRQLSKPINLRRPYLYKALTTYINRNDVNPKAVIGIWLLALSAAVGVTYTGVWLSHTADAFGHLSAIRSLLLYNNAIPQQVFFSVQVPGTANVFGTWHLALALVTDLSRTDPMAVWKFASLILAVIMPLSFSSLAFVISQRWDTALIASFLYIIFGQNFDFRPVAYPNWMGQILMWLVLIQVVNYTRLSISSYSGIIETSRKQLLSILLILVLLSFGAGAVHMQYTTTMVGILGLAIVIAIVSPLPFILLTLVVRSVNERQSKGSSDNELLSNLRYPIAKSNKEIVSYWFLRVKTYTAPFMLASIISLAAALVPFTFNTMIMLASPRVRIITETVEGFSAFDFSSIPFLNEPVTILASILAIGLFLKWIKGESGAFIIISSVLVIPFTSLLLTTFVGSGGYSEVMVQRLIRVIPALIYLCWGWQLSIAIEIFFKYKKPISYKFVLAIIVIAASSLTVNSAVAGPISVYSKNSTYKYSLAESKREDLTVKWADAIQAIENLPDDKVLLSDLGTSYMIIGLTGQKVVSIPTQHTPLLDKDQNNLGRFDVQNFMAGILDPIEEVTVLGKHNVDYVFVNKNVSPIAWNHLPSVAVLEQVASGEDWRLYQHRPEKISGYLQYINQKDKAISNRIAFYQNAANMYPNPEQREQFIIREMNIDYPYALSYIALGEKFQTPLPPSISYNFIDHIYEATLIQQEDNDHIRQSAFVINKTPKGVLYQHANSEISFQLTIPSSSTLTFFPTLAPEVWKLGKGDGVHFEILLETENNVYRIYSKYIDPKNIPSQRAWDEENIGLSQWAGQTVTLTFATDPGPNNDARFDWAGWGEPRIVQAISFDFLDNLPNATLEDGVNQLQVREDIFSIEGEPRDVLFVHPSNQVTYSLNLPEQSTLAFGIGMDPEVWTPAKGDGVVYKVLIRPHTQPNTLYQVFQRYIDPKNNPDDRRWFDERVDLSQFGGQTVDVIFEALPGPNGNANFDWGGWSRPVLLDETVHQEADIAEIPQEDMQFAP